MTHASSRHPHPPNRLLRTCLLVQPPQIISVGIGYAVKRVPTVVESSEVLGQWAGAGLLVYFGLRTLRDAWEKTEEAADDELADAEEEGAPRFRLAWPCAFARLADLCMGMRFLDWRGREVGRRLAMCRRPWRRGADARRPPAASRRRRAFHRPNPARPPARRGRSPSCAPPKWVIRPAFQELMPLTAAARGSTAAASSTSSATGVARPAAAALQRCRSWFPDIECIAWGSRAVCRQPGADRQQGRGAPMIPS